MPSRGVYPLRRSDGPAAVVGSIELIGHSDELEADRITAATHGDVSEVERCDDLRRFHPLAWLRGGGDAVPFAPEVFTCRAPGDLVHPIDQAFASLFIAGPEVLGGRDGRRIWAAFRIDVEDPNDPTEPPELGGLLLSSYPYHPSYLSDVGEPSANHGFPREARISWKPLTSVDVIDDDFGQSFHLPAWQSSIHRLVFGPVRTRSLVLRISDLPRRIETMRSWDEATGRFRETWGVALPFIVPYLHAPTRITGPLRTPGVVCATQSSPVRGDSFFSAALGSDGAVRFAGADAAWIKVHERQAYPFTPQSAILPEGRRRKYPILPNGVTVDERFISNSLGEGDRLHWLLAQRDEHNRCLDGIRIDWTRSEVREALGVGTAPSVRLQIYERDPPPGIAIPAVAPDLAADTFSRLLGDLLVDRELEGQQDIRFDRTMRSKWIYLVFTARDPGQIAIDRVQLLRSAHVSLVSRPSRVQTVDAVHVRFAGDEPGAGGTTLGEPPLTLSVDHVIGGDERRLFEAESVGERVRSGASPLVLWVAVTLPASHRATSSTTDDALQVRFSREATTSDVDVWFAVREQVVDVAGSTARPLP